LGKGNFKSPLNLSRVEGDGIFDFIRDDERILYYNTVSKVKEQLAKGEEPLSFERACTREDLFFEPANTRVAIVTCVSLCPGRNNVISGIVNHNWERDGGKKI